MKPKPEPIVEHLPEGRLAPLPIYDHTTKKEKKRILAEWKKKEEKNGPITILYNTRCS